MSVQRTWVNESQLESQVEAAMDALERVLKELEAPAYARDVVIAVREQEAQIPEEAIRHAIWRLIGDGRATLTDQRKLSAA